MEKKTMMAANLHAVGDLRYEEVPMPERKTGEVLLKVMAAGVCGSDIPRVFEKGTYHFPTIPGHEFAGLIVEADDPALVGKKAAVFLKWMQTMGTSIDEQSKQKAYSLFEDGIINADNSPLNEKYPALNINYAEVTGDGRFSIVGVVEEETPSTEEATSTEATTAPSTEETTEPSTEGTTLPKDETTQAPSTDKDTDKAPNTGDEGIRLYVMASVMALLAMGAVVVVKKAN